MNTETYNWRKKYPKDGDKVIRLPGHSEDSIMHTLKIYTVRCCSESSIQFHDYIGSWEPNYFAPVPLLSTESDYQIY